MNAGVYGKIKTSIFVERDTKNLWGFSAKINLSLREIRKNQTKLYMVKRKTSPTRAPIIWRGKNRQGVNLEHSCLDKRCLFRHMYHWKYGSQQSEHPSVFERERLIMRRALTSKWKIKWYSCLMKLSDHHDTCEYWSIHRKPVHDGLYAQKFHTQLTVQI